MAIKTETTKQGWRKVKLGDVLANVVGGGTPSKSKSEYWNGNIPWVSVKDTQENLYQLWFSKDTITEEGLENSASNLISSGTVILPTRMGLGRVFLNKIDVAINQDLKALIPNKLIDNNFLLWLIASKSKELESLGSGATVMGIRIEQLKGINIEIPEISDQKKIAEVLGAYDDLIEVNQKKIKILEELAQSIYKEWFVKPTQNGIPDGWKIISLNDSEIFSKPKSRTKKFDGEKLYVDTSCIDGLNIIKEPLLVSYNTAPSRAQFTPTYNSVWFARMSNTYKVLVFDKNSNFEVNNYLLSSGMFGIATEEKYLGFLFSLINSVEFHKQKDSRATGATQVSLTDSGFNSIKFIIPTKDLIEKYSSFVNEYIGEILSLQKQNQNLQKTRDLLIPQLVGGKLLIN